MSKEQITFLIGQNCLPSDYVPDIQSIFEEEDHKEPLWLMTEAFMYGVIIGKRQDRARRKKSGVNAV